MIVRARSRYYQLSKPLRGLIHAAAAACVLAISVFLPGWPGAAPVPLQIAPAVFFCVLFAVLHLAPTKVVLGERAVEIRWLGTTRRIELERVASVSADLHGDTHMLSGNLDQKFVTLHDAAIRIVARDGTLVRVRIGGAGDAEEVERRDQLVEAIRRGAGVRE